MKKITKYIDALYVLFTNKIKSILIKGFTLIKRSLLINKEDKFILSFNNFLYEDNDGLLKEIINKGLKENLLEEINLDNQI